MRGARCVRQPCTRAAHLGQLHLGRRAAVAAKDVAFDRLVEDPLHRADNLPIIGRVAAVGAEDVHRSTSLEGTVAAANRTRAGVSKTALVRHSQLSDG